MPADGIGIRLTDALSFSAYQHAMPFVAAQDQIRGTKMNKSDLVAKTADLSCLTTADAGKAVDAVFAAITAALKTGDDVRLAGFGTFSATARPARQGRNPQTGKAITIPAAKAPKFSAGKGLKAAVNG